MKRRTQIDIVKDLLELCLNEPHMQTAIMYRANLSHRQVNMYLNLCINRGFLRKQIEGSRVAYRTTEVGMKFLEAFYVVEDLFKKRRTHEQQAMVRRNEYQKDRV